MSQRKKAATMSISIVEGAPLMHKDASKLITKQEAARMLDVSESKFQNKYQDQLLHYRDGKRVMFAEIDVARLRDRTAMYGVTGVSDLITAISPEVYQSMLADLEMGMDIVAVARKHEVVLPEALKLHRDYERLKKSVVIDDRTLSAMWQYALKRYRVMRPTLDTAESVVALFRRLLTDACGDADQRACGSCPYPTKRRAIICDVCAHKRFAPARKGK